MVDLSWDWRVAASEARERLERRGLRVWERPDHAYEDLGEVQAVDQLTDDLLAAQLFKHQVWYSYATTEWAIAKANVAHLTEVFEVKLADEVYELLRSVPAKATKDVIRGVAIQSNKGLGEFHGQLLSLRQDEQLLAGVVQGLQIRCRALESESIRRTAARKVELGGVSG